jgi:hypothetical protein
MGRPVKKINFGTAAGSDSGILVSAMKTSTARTSYIVAQRGSNKYDVYNATDGTFRVTLAEGTSFAADTAGTAVMVGYRDPGNDATRVTIKKLTARIMTGFDGTRYRWALVNDSSSDYIQLYVKANGTTDYV